MEQRCWVGDSCVTGLGVEISPMMISADGNFPGEMGRKGSAEGIFVSFAKTCFDGSVGVWSAQTGKNTCFLITFLAFWGTELSAHNPEVVGSSPASATKEKPIHSDGFFFGYGSRLCLCHRVMRSASVARWVSEGSAAGGG